MQLSPTTTVPNPLSPSVQLQTPSLTATENQHIFQSSFLLYRRPIAAANPALLCRQRTPCLGPPPWCDSRQQVAVSVHCTRGFSKHCYYHTPFFYTQCRTLTAFLLLLCQCFISRYEYCAIFGSYYYNGVVLQQLYSVISISDGIRSSHSVHDPLSPESYSR